MASLAHQKWFLGILECVLKFEGLDGRCGQSPSLAGDLLVLNIPAWQALFRRRHQQVALDANCLPGLGGWWGFGFGGPHQENPWYPLLLSSFPLSRCPAAYTSEHRYIFPWCQLATCFSSGSLSC